MVLRSPWMLIFWFFIFLLYVRYYKNLKKSTGSTLQSLSNVVTTDLQDGYTLIYDTATNKWVAQPISAGVAAVDGGTY